MRRRSPELGWGEWRILDVGDPRVLAIETRWRDHEMITLHNLSAEPAKVHLPDDPGEPAQGEQHGGRCSATAARRTSAMVIAVAYPSAGR